VGLDHDLAYRGLQAGTFDGTDVYSTDAEVRFYDLRVLEDDRRYFPEYQAVLLYRADLPGRSPAAAALLSQLPGRISDEIMRDLNARAKIRRIPEAQVAAAFLAERFGVVSLVRSDGLLARLGHRTGEHLWLVLLSLLAAVACGVPLGILSARRPRLGQALLALTGTIQTLPSLALLVFMIPLFGIGAVPAVVALFLYSLLPIVRNTYTALREIPPPIRESADALGLPRRAQLRLIELPLAARGILAGIKTAAVINIGTATIGAIIGAGGYGQPILTGIRLSDTALILEGAVPAALLALLAQGLFELVERALVPRGLRVGREGGAP
jgi:osmoprotectant transport system permease protein